MIRSPSTLPADVEATIQRVIGCGIEVHRRLGAGYPERIYRRALKVELESRGTPYECEKEIRIDYRGHHLGTFRLDLVIEHTLVVEIKCVDTLLPVHVSQVLGYLRATGLRAGLLMNFKAATMVEGTKRVVL